MSQSAINTATQSSQFVLIKYSKSYPPSQKTQPTGNSGSEWQHFTNPVIRLVLDVRKSGGELESIRLRILWTLDEEDTSQQREVVFEDIELLLFSNLASRQSQQHNQSLPIKAVYREAVVGIRYLHLNPPREHESNPVYRRFQVTFASSSAASQFIDSIRTVCPCKANATPNQARQPTLASMSAPDTFQNNDARRQQSMRPAPLQRLESMNLDEPTSFNGPVQLPPSVKLQVKDSVAPLNLSSSPLEMPQSSPLSFSSSSQGHNFVPLDQTGSKRQSEHHLMQTVPAAQDPALLIPSQIKPGPVPSSEKMAETLREVTGLYDMPHPELERLIGDIVREDGFARLLENVAKMWNVRSYLGV